MAYRTRPGETQFAARTRLARAAGFPSYRAQRQASPAARARARLHRPDPENLAWSVLAAQRLGLEQAAGYERWQAAGGAETETYEDVWVGLLRLTTDVERRDWFAYRYWLRPSAALARRWRRGPRRARWGWRVEVWIQHDDGRLERHQYQSFGMVLGTARAACLAGIAEYEEARVADPTKYGPPVGAIPVALYKITRR